jgi:hypothetical protein
MSKPILERDREELLRPYIKAITFHIDVFASSLILSGVS